jgi:hypothetical protein
MGTTTDTNPNPPEPPSYFKLGLNLYSSLGKAKALLKKQKDRSAEMREKIGILDRQQFDVGNDLELISEKKLTFNPPTPTQIATIQTSSADLDKMINNSILANDLLILATAAITAWKAPQI